MGPNFDPERVRAFIHAWAEQEHWFQAGRPGLDGYAWPVPASRTVALEGRDAYLAYRDYIAGFVTTASGHLEMHQDVRRLLEAARVRYPGEPDALLGAAVAQDDTFRAQWGNLFRSNPYWSGEVTHELLATYAQKYEVEWPLRVLSCFRELLDRGAYDASLARFRDRAGRLKKGVVVDYLVGGLAAFPYLRDTIRLAYSPQLRNRIGHNEYVIDGDAVCGVDGTVAETREGLWRRIDALVAIQNTLLWAESTTKHDPVALASRGIVGLGWAPLEYGSEPRLFVMQLAAFRQYAPAAAWLDRVTITRGRNRLDTTVGEARAHGGPLTRELEATIDRVSETGRLTCEVLGIVPCLHVDDPEHTTFELPDGRFCEVEPPVERVVPAVVHDAL